MKSFNLTNQSDIANFHQFAAGYAQDNRQYTENGSAQEVLDHLLYNSEQLGETEAQAMRVPAEQVTDAKTAFLFAAGE